jgi:glycosyltransferase involved in cell wall biosynthesis
MKKPSVCIITCYKQPDYVRAVALRQGLRDTGLFEDVITVKNTYTNALRYAEVLGRLIKIRFSKNPDFYVLTFRGYEMLPFVWLLTIGKKLIYDEFINPVEWFVYEHKKFKPDSVPARLLRSIFRWFGRRAATILTDTQSHADYSAELMSLPITKYRAIPVGTDEKTFHPMAPIAHDGFRVLYYGNMLPLHGLEYAIDAAKALAGRSDITFHFVGGKQPVVDMISAAQAAGAHIEYDKWIDFQKLPEVFAASDLLLGGPFGGTVQSQFVVTGKTYQFIAAARPAVVGENKESHVFTDKENALLVPQADAEALARVIAWGADNRDELEKIGQRGRKLYEDQFSSKRIASDLTLLFQEYGVLDVEAGTHEQQQN